MLGPARGRSPRIAALRRRRQAGDRSALDRFWQQVREEGTPLIEPLRRDDGHVLVTFLWRAAGVDNVVLLGSCFPDIPQRCRLRRLLDTDVWHASFRLPSDTRFGYRFSINDPLVPAHRLTIEQVNARFLGAQVDPFNRQPLPNPLLGVSSSATLPAAPAQPWLVPRPGLPRGAVHEHTFASVALGNTRSIWVYTPPGYSSGGVPYGVVVLLDGQTYIAGDVLSTTLDNLAADGLIPPLVGVAVSSIDLPTRTRELACHPPFVAFLVSDLLPWVRRQYHVTATAAETTLVGASLGGLTAAFAALERPDVFGNVVSQSGSFWWSADKPEWLTRRVVHQERRPVRFYLEAGLMEDRPHPTRSGPSLLLANRHLRDVLEAKGYEVHYAEFNGGHDLIWWRGTLADGLLAVRGAPASHRSAEQNVPVAR